MRVLVGQDTRESGPRLAQAIADGLAAQNCHVELCGVLPTPALSHLTRSQPDMDLGIVISASHNPYHDNGVKLFDADGGKLTEATEAAIESELAQLQSGAAAATPIGTIRADAPERYGKEYMRFCRDTSAAWVELTDWNIVVDCANGAGGELVPRLLEDLGAHVTAVANQPNGRNINADCGATCPEFILRETKKHGADIGLALDGDGDRLLAVDEKGGLADGDDLLYVLAHARQKTDMLFDGGVVGTEMTNLGLEHALRRRGIPFDRATVGDRHVMRLLVQHDWFLGGEPSGHIICRDISPTGDALVTALQVLQALTLLQCSLHELREEIQKFPQAAVNVSCPVDWRPGEAIDTAAASAQTELGDNGRVVVRRSGTEPLLRIMVEARNETQARYYAEQIAGVAQHATQTGIS